MKFLIRAETVRGIVPHCGANIEVEAANEWLAKQEAIRTMVLAAGVPADKVCIKKVEVISHEPSSI